MTDTFIYAGKIYERENHEGYDDLFISDFEDEPFAFRFQDDLDMFGRYASVSYWITDEPKGLEELLENQVKLVVGAADADYTMHYSDITGYLWTDEKCVVGGHDLLAELRTSLGRYVHMIVTFSKEPFK